MSKKDKKNCNRCRFFVWLSQEEKVILDSITDYSLSQSGSYGVCVGHNKFYTNLFIQRVYGWNENTFCSLYEEGPLIDPLNIFCPSCRKAHLNIMYSDREKGDRKIKCSNSECGKEFSQIKLNVKCRFCGGDLKLSANKNLLLFCQYCRTYVVVPVSLRVWPNLFAPHGGCSHFFNDIFCETCDESRLKRKNLLELELPNYIGDAINFHGINNDHDDISIWIYPDPENFIYDHGFKPNKPVLLSHYSIAFQEDEERLSEEEYGNLNDYDRDEIDKLLYSD